MLRGPVLNNGCQCLPVSTEAGNTLADQHRCQSKGCQKLAKMKCPTCIELKLEDAYFCCQPCFKASWREHKSTHRTTWEEEANTGVYDMVGIFREVVLNPKKPLSHPELKGPVEKHRISDQKGFGLLATRDVEPGELLIASKAFSVGFFTIACFGEMNFDRATDKERDIFIDNTIGRIASSECYAKEFYGLYAGQDYPPNESIPAQVNRNHVEEVLRYNSFGFSMRDKPNGDRHPFRGEGLWVLPSFINHSCAPNCTRYCLGDFMFVRAQQKISEGEELTLSYVDSTARYESRQRGLSSTYGINCTCPLCECDKNVTEDLLLKRYDDWLCRDLDVGWPERSLAVWRRLSRLAFSEEWSALTGENSANSSFVAAPNLYALRYCVVVLSELQLQGKANSSEAKHLAEKLLKCAEIEFGKRQALEMFLLMSPYEKTKTAVDLTRKLLAQS